MLIWDFYKCAYISFGSCIRKHDWKIYTYHLRNWNLVFWTHEILLYFQKVLEQHSLKVLIIIITPILDLIDEWEWSMILADNLLI